MKRQHLGFIPLALVLCLFSSQSVANCRTESSCFKPHVRYQIDNGKLANVCTNYTKGHWKYRRCKMAANRKFRDLCHDYREKARRAKDKSKRKQFKRLHRAYCSFRY